MIFHKNHRSNTLERGNLFVFALRRIFRLLLATCCLFFVVALLTNLSPTTLNNVMRHGRQLKSLEQGTAWKDILHNVFDVSNTNSTGSGAILPLHNNSMFIYSAIAYNTTETNHYDVIHISGWEDRFIRNKTKGKFTCCLIYNNGGFHKNIGTRLRARNDWYYVGRSRQEVKQYLCENVLSDQGLAPVAVTLGNERSCPKDYSKYVKVVYPKRLDGVNIGVCAKLIYGNISASLIVEWFEYQRYMGISKVVAYTSNLNQQARKALEYYEELGIAELFPFELPKIDGRARNVGVKNFQGWNDEQIAAFDCQGRLSGYKFIGLYDIDEYILPISDSNLVSMMDRLQRQHPKAGGFQFKTQIYATTWGLDTSEDAVPGLTIGQYSLRTETFRDRIKAIVHTERIVPGRMSTHGYWAKSPFKKATVDDRVALLKHYRTCRKEWMKKDGKLCKEMERFRDTSMFKLASKLRDRVQDTQNRLGINAENNIP